MSFRQQARSSVAVLFVLGIVSGALVVAVRPAGAVPAVRATVDMAAAAILAPDGMSVTIEVTASCARSWEVVEGFVAVSQTTYGEGVVDLRCTGRARTFTVVVPTYDEPFDVGPAFGSAFFLFGHRPAVTESAEDFHEVAIRRGT